MQAQPRGRKQRTSERSQQDWQANHHAAFSQSFQMIRAPQARMQYLDRHKLQDQNQNQVEKIRFLPRAP